MKIGILAIQGSVIEHVRATKQAAQNLNLDIEVIEVRLPEDFKDISGIILPGGESTTQSKLMKRYGLFEELQKKIQAGLPVWGTCAGAILLAKEVSGKENKVLPDTLAVMDIHADRNAYGTQVDSFINSLDMQFNDELQKIEAVFIRAPKLTALNDSVQTLATDKDESVALQKGSMLVTSFHPELTDDTKVHEYFLSMCQ